MAEGPLRAPRSPDGGREHEAGVARPRRDRAAERAWHGTRLVARATGRHSRDRPARTTARNAADVARARPAEAPPARPGRGPRLAYVAPDRSGRVSAGRLDRKGAPGIE